MRRKKCVLAAAVVVTMLLAGCGNQTQIADNGNGAAAGSTVQPQPQTEDEVEATEKPYSVQEGAIPATVEGEPITPGQMGLEDGTYYAELTEDCESADYYVKTPAEVTIKDGNATVVVQWNTAGCKSMRVGDKEYAPFAGAGGFSSFRIPMERLNEPMETVITVVENGQSVEYGCQLRIDSTTVEQ